MVVVTQVVRDVRTSRRVETLVLVLAAAEPLFNPLQSAQQRRGTQPTACAVKLLVTPADVEHVEVQFRRRYNSLGTGRTT